MTEQKSIGDTSHVIVSETAINRLANSSRVIVSIQKRNLFETVKDSIQLTIIAFQLLQKKICSSVRENVDSKNSIVS